MKSNDLLFALIEISNYLLDLFLQNRCGKEDRKKIHFSKKEECTERRSSNSCLNESGNSWRDISRVFLPRNFRWKYFQPLSISKWKNNTALFVMNRARFFTAVYKVINQKREGKKLKSNERIRKEG